MAQKKNKKFTSRYLLILLITFVLIIGWFTFLKPLRAEFVAQAHNLIALVSSPTSSSAPVLVTAGALLETTPGGWAKLKGTNLSNNIVIKGATYQALSTQVFKGEERVDFKVDPRETPGTYQIYLTSPYGRSNILPFTVIPLNKPPVSVPSIDLSGPTPIGSSLMSIWRQNGTINFYTLPGKQTLRTSTITAASMSITSTSNKHNQVQYIMDWLHSNIKNGTCGGADVRTRTAEQIINSKCATGCTDWTMAFAAIARSKGLSATVTETIQDQWIKASQTAGRIIVPKQGHFFSEVYTGASTNGGWEIADPTAGNFTTTKNGYVLRRSSGDSFGQGTYYQFFRRGLDSWDYYLRNDKDFIDAVRVQFGLK